MRTAESKSQNNDLKIETVFEMAAHGYKFQCHQICDAI